MNRLEAELQRLYLAGAEGGTRTIVLELGRPASWESLGPVWQGVQADLELPAPAIAVSGVDSYQLWFSFTQPIPVASAAGFAESLRRRYLAGVKHERIAIRHDAPPPPQEKSPGQWSAFLAPDLAALFAGEPWLDMPPSAEAQAEVLARLRGIQPAELQQAMDRLVPTELPAAAPVAAGGAESDPRRFLLGVMNDSSVDLRLRIEAAKALL